MLRKEVKELNNLARKGSFGMRRTFLISVAAVLIFVFALSAISFAGTYGNAVKNQATAQTIAQNSLRSQTGACGNCYNGYGKAGAMRRTADWAEALGITTDELAALRQQGKTIEEIAKEKGLNIEDVVDKVLEKDREYLDSLVKSGKLTADDAQKILEFRKARVLERAKTGPGRPSWAGSGKSGAFQCRGNCGACQGLCAQQPASN